VSDTKRIRFVKQRDLAIVVEYSSSSLLVE